jgi:hypothetical protein
MKKDFISLTTLICLIFPTINDAQPMWDSSGTNSAEYYPNYDAYSTNPADDANDNAYNGLSTSGYYPYYSGYDSVNNMRYYPNDDAYRFNDPLNGYSTPDYDYNSHYYGRMDGGYQNSSGFIRFGRRFDNSNHFSSGISSYQGTSTGPGPNGGYPGAPRGIYQTYYFDTSIYPNSYMRVYSR